MYAKMTEHIKKYWAYLLNDDIIGRILWWILNQLLYFWVAQQIANGVSADLN